MQARLERLESSLERTEQRIDKFESRGPQGRAVSSTPDLLALSTFPGLYFAGFSQPILDAAALELPPRLEVTFAVEKYLKTMNSVLPIFNPEKLRHRVQNWFENRIDHRDCATWAAINVVLALAHRHTSTDKTKPDRNVTHFLKNAQSVLHEVIMGKPDILNVQLLVGMVMLFQATLDLKPAAMLIALTLRLAHELGLHTQSCDGEYTNPAEKLERDRVFWIAYILDCDISMRTKQPPVQRHIDIDIDWPLAMPEDEAGLITGIDGSAGFNFFLSRVELARIQAEVYEVMFSTRAKSLNNYERLESMARLRYTLDNWMSGMPPQFLPNAILQIAEPHVCRAFAVLYASHLACRTWVCKAHIMESAWLQHLQVFGRVSTQSGTVVPVPPLPQGWDVLVSEAREYMRLFMSIEWKDPAFIW